MQKTMPETSKMQAIIPIMFLISFSCETWLGRRRACILGILGVTLPVLLLVFYGN